MCACAFFAALRVGEITCRPGESVTNLINLEQIFEMRNRRGVVEAIKLSLIHFKHSDTLHPVDILIYRNNPVCPVSLLSKFLQLRGSSRGPLFSWPNNQAISRSFFTNCLNQTLDFCGLDRSRYKSHSFRIGAASWAAPMHRLGHLGDGNQMHSYDISARLQSSCLESNSIRSP